MLVSGPYVFDNAYVEFFLYGGVVGLFLCLGILLVIFLTALQGLRTDFNWELLIFLILIIGASIGAPVLTLNRSSIFLWVIIVITFMILAKSESQRNSTSKMINSTKKRLRFEYFNKWNRNTNLR